MSQNEGCELSAQLGSLRMAIWFFSGLAPWPCVLRTQSQTPHARFHALLLLF